jgi:hypothetical protein
MTPERLEDHFRFYRAKPHQQQGIRLLHQAIRDGLPPEQVLVEEAPWALAYSQAPLALPPSGGLDPRGAEEEGLAGPAIAAPVVAAGDSYLLVNDRDQDMEAYDHSSRLLWQVPCLAGGQVRDNQWCQRNSDTPPGLYKLGAI